MISENTIVRVIQDLDRYAPVRVSGTINHYGERREGILAYLLSFREHLSQEKLEELLQFFVLLVMLCREVTGEYFHPSESLINEKNESVRAQVRFIWGEESSSMRRAVDCWLDGFEEKAILGYAIRNILVTCDMKTEEGVQMYIAIISLILIFTEGSKGPERPQHP